MISLILLLLLLGLGVLLAQNWSPVSLVFLGITTPTLPLAMWILLSLIAGAMTSLFIAGCFKLSNYFVQPKPRRPREKEKVEPSPPRPSPQSNEPNYTAASKSPSTDPSRDNMNDWESYSSSDNDWGFEEDTNKTQKPGIQDTAKDHTSYEVNTQPKSGTRSGSVYSYSYQEPSNSGVGKTESIYDADYRVLTPPYRQTNTTENKDDWGDDDWGLEDDLGDQASDSPRQGR